MIRSVAAVVFFSVLATHLHAQDTWTPTDTTGAPSARCRHTAVWTGQVMIVWGGDSGGSYLNTGSKYDPATNTWTAISTTNAPAGRSRHTAVWTGQKMLVWGGFAGIGQYFDNGGQYDPATDTWTAISTTGAPTARNNHRTVWSGTEMITWGGHAHVGGVLTTYASGGRYNPATDTWRTTSLTNAPQKRAYPSVVWSGTRMLVWGGQDETAAGSASLNSGSLYDPVADSWTAMTTTGAPSARSSAAIAWTGSEMIVWGGLLISPLTYLNTGGRYNPSTNSWRSTSTTGAPSARVTGGFGWTGSEFVIWGGMQVVAPFAVFQNGGARYTPSTDSWVQTTNTGAPAPRHFHSTVWTGSKMIFWGGENVANAGNLNDGGLYSTGAAPPPPPAGLTVTPATGFSSSGPVAGPFLPSSATYTLQNTGATSLNWTATATQTWLTVTPANGTLLGGASTTLTVQVNANANILAAGTYNDTISIVDTTNGVGNTTRTATLIVTGAGGGGPMTVSPSTTIAFTGPAGGPFAPTSATFTVGNSGSQPIAWSVSSTQSWIILNPTSGAISAGGTAPVSVTLSPSAATLPLGSFLDTLTFTNTTNGSGNAARRVSLVVGASSVAGGGEGSSRSSSKKGSCGSIGLDLMLPLLGLFLVRRFLRN